MTRDLWRIIISGPANGAWNMAMDEAILSTVAKHESLPTLRLYSWDPPCLSLGQAQRISDVDQKRLTNHGWDLVRRPTGGRAILHTDELTYSICAHQDEPHVAGTILESYRRLSLALLCALDLLGIKAAADQEYQLPTGAQSNGAVCFEVPSNYEITVNGQKLIGSAQARRFGGVLQHGSLPLYGEITRITQVLLFLTDVDRVSAAQRLSAHATTLENLVGKRLTWENAVNAFILAFEKALNIDFLEDQPSEPELAKARELFETKYNASEWTYRK